MQRMSTIDAIVLFLFYTALKGPLRSTGQSINMERNRSSTTRLGHAQTLHVLTHTERYDTYVNISVSIMTYESAHDKRTRGMQRASPHARKWATRPPSSIKAGTNYKMCQFGRLRSPESTKGLSKWAPRDPNWHTRRN